MGARAERLAGIDDDVDRAGLRIGPRRPDEDPPADEYRLVEILPAVGPVVRDLLRGHLDEPVAGRSLQIRKRGEFAGGAVDRVFDPAWTRLLLDASGRQLDEVGEDALGEVWAAANREPDQRRRRERRPNGPRPSRRPPSGPSASSSCRASSRCSLVRRVGTNASTRMC